VCEQRGGRWGAEERAEVSRWDSRESIEGVREGIREEFNGIIIRRERERR